MAVSVEAAAIRHLALIGNFLPRQCGLATFTTDVYTAVRDRFPDVQVDVYAMDDHVGRYDYPDAVVGTIPEQDLSAYLDTARTIEASGAQAIWIQHEYGIYGGPALIAAGLALVAGLCSLARLRPSIRNPQGLEADDVQPGAQVR